VRYDIIYELYLPNAQEQGGTSLGRILATQAETARAEDGTFYPDETA
jgi:hypothetical protein